MMLTVIFVITTTIAAFMWFKWRIATLAIIYYIEKKQYIQPDDREMRKCTAWVIKNMFKRQ